MRLEVEIKKAVEGFSLDISIKSDAQRIGVLGPSGSGKSMTLKCIAGIDRVDKGHIVLDGRTLYDSESGVGVIPQNRRVGYLFQNYALFPTMTVMQNIMAAVKGPRSKKREAADAILCRFGLKELQNRLPHELSGGQQQRTALARIMAAKPDLILLDEPFSALDGHIRGRMQEELNEMLRNFQGQVLMVSHDLDDICRFSEDLFIVSAGKIIRGGRKKDVLNFPESVETARTIGIENISEAIRLNDRRLRIPDWGVELAFSERTVPEDTQYVGYMAQDFIPVWGDCSENCIPCRISRRDKLTHKTYYHLETCCGAASTERNDAGRIMWTVSGSENDKVEETGEPDHLKISEKCVFFLRDE